MSKATKKAECIVALHQAERDKDTENAHMNADRALLDYIDDPEIREAYEDVPRWYA